MVTVSIEMKSYLVKYLLTQSENHEQPMIFSRKHPYNILLVNLATNYYQQKSFPIEDRENVISFLAPTDIKEKAVIKLPYSDKKNIEFYNYLSVASKKRFRQVVKDDFHLDLYRYMISNLTKDQRLIVLENFLKIFDINDDDIKPESLYRHTTRVLHSKQYLK